MQRSGKIVVRSFHKWYVGRRTAREGHWDTSEHGGTDKMAKIDESQLGDDFSYIIRIADSDIDGLKQVKQGLTSIRGIGERCGTDL